jgi:phosphatidylglycerophosphate synthase
MALENKPLPANLKREAARDSLLGLVATVLVGVLLMTVIGSTLASVAAAAIVFCLFLASMARSLPEHSHATLGPANRVTIFRCALVVNCAALVLQPDIVAAHAWTVVSLMVLAFALDGADGWLARRFGFASRFGARFDQELDAFFTLILAATVFALGKAGPWILLSGLWHYLFWGLASTFPALKGELPPAYRRKAVCVINISALILCVAPPVQPPVSAGIAGLALLLLSASFLTDMAWLAGHRSLARGLLDRKL